MDTGTRILILGGMSMVACGFLLGIGMIAARSKAARAPRYLLAAHLAALIQGGLLLGLAFAVGSSSPGGALETTGAAVLLGGVALFDLGLVSNWLQGVQDGFGEKSPGNKISAVGTPLVLVGFAMLFWVVLAGL
ncbi:MAG: hypothetical protein P8099_06265 [Gemmatimonadota bacterium]